MSWSALGKIKNTSRTAKRDLLPARDRANVVAHTKSSMTFERAPTPVRLVLVLVICTGTQK